jgi:hypothetical protein
VFLTATSNEILQAESFVVDPVLFALEARYLTTRQHECLNLVKQHLARIGIKLDLVYFNISEVGFPATLLAFRDFDLHIQELPCSYVSDPFLMELYTENGSLNLSGYHTSMDWDGELGTGRNEWYIQTGLPMTPNDSLDRINMCWEWQHYMMDDILPILPLFTQKDNHSTFEFLFFNMREVRAEIGSREPALDFPSKTKGLFIRKAISYAINREEIRRVVYGDGYETIHHPTNPVLEDWLSPNSIRYCYNLDFAKNLMIAVGFGPYSRPPFENPDWEDLCGDNPSSVSASGFSYMMVFTVASITFASWIIIRSRKRRIN